MGRFQKWTNLQNNLGDVRMTQEKSFEENIREIEENQKATEEKFKKEFPSLVGKHFEHDPDIAPIFNVYSDRAIIENCLDKQKVRNLFYLMRIEAKYAKGISGFDFRVKGIQINEVENLLQFIEKELGL